MGMKQRELLVAVDPVLGVVDVEHPRVRLRRPEGRLRPGTSAKLSQNSSIIAAIIRLSALGPGRFSSRLMVWGCGDPTPRSRSTASTDRRRSRAGGRPPA
jgi:hypothetical protein